MGTAAAKSGVGQNGLDHRRVSRVSEVAVREPLKALNLDSLLPAFEFETKTRLHSYLA
jgi:hypothetical protein